MGTGSTIILARGKVLFSIKTPTRRESTHLKGVLFSSNYATNVVSLAKILNKGFLVDFSSSTIANLEGYVVILFRRKGSMFIVAQNPDTPISKRVGSISPLDITLVGSLIAPTTPSLVSFTTKARKSARQKLLLIANSKDLYEIYSYINKETLKYLSDNVTSILITNELIVL